MNRWLRAGLVAGFLLLTGCPVPQKAMHTMKPVHEVKRDEVECLALAKQAGGDGYGWVYDVKVRELYEKCLEGRGWVAK